MTPPTVDVHVTALQSTGRRGGHLPVVCGHVAELIESGRIGDLWCLRWVPAAYPPVPAGRAGAVCAARPLAGGDLVNTLSAAIWCGIWLLVAGALGIALWVVYDAVERAAERLLPDDADEWTDPLRPAGERRRP